MPRNGSGEYSLPAGYQATTGQTATAAQHNDPLEDIESVLNDAVPVVKGGTGATSASAALTNLGVTAAGQALLDDADAAAQRTTLGAQADWSYLDGVDLDNGGADDLTTIDFTGIPDGVMEIEIALYSAGISGTDDIIIQIGSGGTIITTDYDSYSAQIGITDTEIFRNTGFVIYNSASTYRYSGIIRLRRNKVDGQTWYEDHNLLGSSTQAYGSVGAGVYTTGTTGSYDINEIRMKTTGTNTFINGSARVRYR